MLLRLPGDVKGGASIGRRPGADGRVEGGALLANSTPDALWNASALRLLRPSAVACRDLRLRRGRETLLDGVTLSVPAGARLLLVSRPDESASALLRILAGLTRAERGEVELAGLEDPSPAGWGRRVAYVGPQPGVYPWMTPREALALAGRLHGLDAGEIDVRIGRLAGPFGLWRALERPISRGGPPFEQRVAFVAALLGEPEVLLLDEPLRAIDPDERQRLLRIPGARRTVVLASRYPASEAGLCTHVALLANGRLVLVAPISQLEEQRLPLSMRGIEALAAAGRGPEPGPPHVAHQPIPQER